MFKFVTQKGCNRQELNHDYLCYKQSYYSNIEYSKQKKQEKQQKKKQNLRLRSQEPVTLRGDVILNDRILLAPVAETKIENKNKEQIGYIIGIESPVKCP